MLPTLRCFEPDARPGTYALLLRLASTEKSILIGRQSQCLPLAMAWAVYVGSAFGPGGVASRLRHHCRLVARPHWHVDYLRRYATLETVWYSYDSARHECLWAEVLGQNLGGQAPPFRFGASDCRCRTHLYWFASALPGNAFVTALSDRIRTHAEVFEYP